MFGRILMKLPDVLDQTLDLIISQLRSKSEQVIFPAMMSCPNTADFFSCTSLLRKSGVWRRLPKVLPVPSVAWHMEQFFLYHSPAESALTARAPATRPAG